MTSAEAIVVRAADEKELLKEAPITSIAMTFKPSYWWYPVYDMFRRLIMTCVVLVFELASSITLFVLGTALVTIVFERETSPYINIFLTKFSYILCWQVVGAILAMLLADASMTSRGGDLAIGVTLTSGNIALGLAVFHALRKEKRDTSRHTHDRPEDEGLEDQFDFNFNYAHSFFSNSPGPHHHHRDYQQHHEDNNDPLAPRHADDDSTLFDESDIYRSPEQDDTTTWQHNPTVEMTNVRTVERPGKHPANQPANGVNQDGGNWTKEEFDDI